MTQIIVGENEGIESALRRFRRGVSRAGIFLDLKKKIVILKLPLKSASAKPKHYANSVAAVIVAAHPNRESPN